MTNLTDYSEKVLLDWLMTNSTTPVRSTAWWVALHSSAPGEAGTLFELGAGIGYTRLPVTFGVAASPAGITLNSSTVTFGPATSAWIVTNVSITDTSATTANVLWQGAASSKTVSTGDYYQFSASNFSLTLA